MNDNINITSIETHLYAVLRNNVSEQCYAGTLPSTLSEKIDSYVVIDSTNALYDYEAYGRGIVNIYLYAKPIGNGQKNVAALSKLEKAFNKALLDDAFDDDNYSIPREVAYSHSGYDNAYGMHYIIKAIRIIIK